MKKLTLIVLAVVLIALTSPFANGQNNIWSLPPNYLKNGIPFPLPVPQYQLDGVTPNNPIIPSDGYDGQPSNFVHNAMQDENGDLLFFIIDGNVYNKDGAQATGFSSSQRGFAAELVILPNPTDCNKYYILSAEPENVNFGIPYFYELEKEVYSIPGQPDAINYTLNSIPFSFYLSGEAGESAFRRQFSFAVTPLRASDNSHLLFMTDGIGSLKVFKIDGNGITFSHNLDLPNILIDNPNSHNERDEMEVKLLSNGNYRFAKTRSQSDATGNYRGIHYFLLDQNGFEISNNTFKMYYNSSQTSVSQPFVKGLEFSENSDYLYFTHITNANYPYPFEYINLTNGVVSPINTATEPELQYSFIEMGKDNKLYLVTNNGLRTLSNSNAPNPSNFNGSALLFSYSANFAGISNPSTSDNQLLKLYQLPDQIDGMNYAEHFTANTECCIANTTFSTTTYPKEQSGTQSWTTSANPFGNVSTITVKDELIIKTGANITATGLRFEFAPDAKLTIEQGARFTANSCVFTVNTECENSPMWNGIEVHGPSANQQSVDAGRFIVNNSTIENSYLGAHNFKTMKSGTPGEFWEEHGYRGGVILATNTTFKNNHRGTVFFDFQNKNAVGNFIDDESKFYNCTFVTDALLNKPTLTPTVIMAHLFDVQGVNFLGCDFKNTDVSIAPHERGSGIEAYNCLLTVTSMATGGLAVDRSKFINLTRGVDAYSSIGSPRTTRINNTDFDNVWRCIYLKSNELATITNNTFDVASDNAWSHGYGLYLDYCNRFKVENNNFTTTHNGFIGTYTWDSQQGTNNNEIYKNTFSNFVIGSQAAGNNGNRSAINGGLGLEYRCNNYSNINNADIYVSSGWIKPFHGQCGAALTAPSNNKFSYTAQYGDFLQDPAVDYVSYQHSIGANLAPRNGYYYAPNTNPTVCSDTYNATTSCPTRMRKSLIELKDNLAVEKNVVSNLNENIAEGDAKALYQAIQTQSAGNVKNTLMAASPYLSDDVLLAYIGSNAPHGNLKQVLIANSPLSQAVLNALQQSNLPKGIKTQITNAQTGTSAMEELKTEIAYHKNEVSKIQNDVLRYILFEDDIIERYKEAIEFIKQESACFEKRCELIAFYTINKEYTKAEQELSDIAQYQENTDFVKLYSNILTLKQTTDAIEELKTNTSIQQPVIEVAEMPIRKQETAMAEVMLKQAKLRNYQEPIEELNVVGSGLRLMNQNEEDKKTSNLELLTLNSVNVYPNPTSGEVNITHNLNVENGKVTFKVYNMLGVEVLNENLSSTNHDVKLQNLQSGVYFYSITQNNQTIKTDKLMVK